MEKDIQHDQRFYLWDYLWWQGEMIMLRLLPAQTRMAGCIIVFGYIMALIIVPLLLLSLRIFSADTIIAQVIVCGVVVLAGFSRVERLYRRRGKTVMRHYSKRGFYPIVGILFLLIPFAMIFTMAYYSGSLI
ncbi:MAG: hypothetical protein Q4C34_08950 [Bacteroidales bacterium]|nr:hypothetical protein [Bacteroidales bacterium]